MKKLILLLLLSFWCGVARATSYVDDANCQGAWLFTEGSGTTVADATTNNRDGTFEASGQPAWASMSGTNAPSYATYMVDFNGNYIDCGTALNFEPFSIVTWVSIDNMATLYQGILTTSDGIGNNEWNIQYNFHKPSKIAIYAYPLALVGANDNSTSNWQHIATTNDATTQLLYIDGVLQTETSTGAYLAGSGNFMFGRLFYNNALYALDGKMTETAEFNDVLSSTEIDDIMDNGLVGAAPPSRHEMFMVN